MSALFNYYNQNIAYSGFNPLFRNSLNSARINNNFNIYNTLYNSNNNMNYNLNTINNLNIRNSMRNNTIGPLNNNQMYNNLNFINSQPNNNIINRIIYFNEEHVPSSPLLSKEQTNKIMNQLNTCVCKINKLNGENATGFFCNIPFSYSYLPVLITNNHVLNEEDIKPNRIIKFSLKDGEIEKILIINESRITFTNKDLDVTIIEIFPEIDGIKDFLEVDEDINEFNLKEKIKDAIYIPQYPEGKAYISFGVLDKKSSYPDIIYSCSTSIGSSGAPILYLINYKVIGVHRGSKENLNAGTLMKYIIEAFKKINKSKFKLEGKDKESKIKYFNNNEYYVGHLKKGKVTIYYSDGKIKYEGDCLDGNFEGNGTYYYKEKGNRYDGQWKKGLKHGKGILYYDHEAKTKRYKGNFFKGKFEGKGIYYWEDGSYYTGDFVNGLKHGYGKYYKKDGTLKYEGYFVNDKFEGKGKYNCDNGDYYDGDFKNGLKHGKGTLYNKKGDIILKGIFINNKYQNNKL